MAETLLRSPDPLLGPPRPPRQLPSRRAHSLLTRRSKPTYDCSHCPYSTDRKNNLKRHLATMHETSTKALECCATRFANKSALRDHVSASHAQGAGYACAACGRRFGRKALMRRHAAVHSGQRPFACHECEYATSHRSNLDRHVRRHTGGEGEVVGGVRRHAGGEEGAEGVRRQAGGQGEEPRRVRRREVMSKELIFDEISVRQRSEQCTAAEDLRYSSSRGVELHRGEEQTRCTERCGGVATRSPPRGGPDKSLLDISRTLEKKFRRGRGDAIKRELSRSKERVKDERRQNSDVIAAPTKIYNVNKGCNLACMTLNTGAHKCAENARLHSNLDLGWQTYQEVINPLGGISDERHYGFEISDRKIKSHRHSELMLTNHVAELERHKDSILATDDIEGNQTYTGHYRHTEERHTNPCNQWRSTHRNDLSGRHQAEISQISNAIGPLECLKTEASEWRNSNFLNSDTFFSDRRTQLGLGSSLMPLDIMWTPTGLFHLQLLYEAYLKQAGGFSYSTATALWSKLGGGIYGITPFTPSMICPFLDPPESENFKHVVDLNKDSHPAGIDRVRESDNGDSGEKSGTGVICKSADAAENLIKFGSNRIVHGSEDSYDYKITTTPVCSLKNQPDGTTLFRQINSDASYIDPLSTSSECKKTPDNEHSNTDSPFSSAASEPLSGPAGRKPRARLAPALHRCAPCDVTFRTQVEHETHNEARHRADWAPLCVYARDASARL